MLVSPVFILLPITSQSEPFATTLRWGVQHWLNPMTSSLLLESTYVGVYEHNETSQIFSGLPRGLHISCGYQSSIFAVHWSSFIRATCPAHFILLFLIWWAMSQIPVLFLISSFVMQSLSIIPSVGHSTALTFVPSFSSSPAFRAPASHSYIIAGITVALKISELSFSNRISLEELLFLR